MRRNILITGASSGLGAEMARQFAAKGHNLVLTARREDRLKALQAELSGQEGLSGQQGLSGQEGRSGTTVVTYRLDVTDHEQVFEVFRAADAELDGGLDRIIVNAGVGKGTPLGTGRVDANLEKPIKVSAIFPGYIRSELNEHVANTPFVVDTEVGVRAIVAAIEAEKAKAYVPGWPWAPLARVMRLAPLPLLRRMI